MFELSFCEFLLYDIPTDMFLRGLKAVIAIHGESCCLQGMCLSGADSRQSRERLRNGIMTRYKDMCYHCVVTCDTTGPVATVTHGSECNMTVL